MAYHSISNPTGAQIPHRIWGAVKSFAGLFATAMVTAASTNQRLEIVDRLNAKSDEELARMGLRREDILRYVFIDILDV